METGFWDDADGFHRAFRDRRRRALLVCGEPPEVSRMTKAKTVKYRMRLRTGTVEKPPAGKIKALYEWEEAFKTEMRRLVSEDFRARTKPDQPAS